MTRYQANWQSVLHHGAATEEQVNTLLSRVPHATVFNTPEWCQAAAGCLAPGRALHVLTIRDGDGLAAWLPLVCQRERVHGIPVATLRLLGHPFNDRVAMPILPGNAELVETVLDALFACPQHWDLLVLSELHDPGERKLLAERAPASVEWRPCSRSPVLRLSFDSETALRASYGKALTTRLARARRKLAGAGAVRFERLLPRPHEVPRLVSLCKAIEDISWKGSHNLGIFSAPANERFFSDVGVRFAARGWLDIGMLYVNEKLISYRFGFRYHHVFQDFNLAFDPAYAACAPGRVLLDEMIVSSLRQRLEAVDASRSSVAEPHLLADWTADGIEHHELWLFRPTWRGRLVGWARRTLRPAVRRLRARPYGCFNA